MCGRRHQNHTLAVRQSGNREAADGATEELFILIKLDDVVGGGRLGKKVAPRFVLVVFNHNDSTPKDDFSGDLYHLENCASSVDHLDLSPAILELVVS